MGAALATTLRAPGQDVVQEKGSASAGEAPPRKLKICLSPGLLGVRISMKDSIGLASRFGFEAIEPITGELAAMSPDEMAAFREEFKSKGLTWGAAGIGTPFAQPQDAYQTWLAKLPESAAVLQKAGATRVQTWVTPGDNHLTYLENFHRHVRRVRDIATVYDDHGVRFGVEYVGPKTSRDRSRYEFIHTMREMRELIAEVNKPSLGLILDSWHWYTSAETPADVRALSGHDVISVHLNDAPAGIPVDQQIDGRRALPATTGVIDIGGFLSALIAIGYDGPAATEPFNAGLRRMPKEKAVEQASEAIHKALTLAAGAPRG